ncbi:uncharacterized protein FOMMEDRAFT_135535 [Fomitiporia mediterranea MF3/22]|uniref:uncharacterized protein n=1 Tax=Fomitiporia mediterranea (strain MF3/22) TaxID=694068 RepID=UPI000440745D|nr:uncharacterized protein FOMMEDRAFT_135535 [Fomitiporia mediterranea MF3/22]EJD01299.1 hypothetical protein FOMMEDRAFT_135535 [Fomitiporia mediterranea MF3/22]
MAGTILELIGTATNGTNPETKQVVQANAAARIAWLVLNIWPSHLGLPLLIGTIFLAKNIKRHATFINLCVTWIIVGVSSSLLLYAGHQTGPEPPRTLCLIQASLLYGQPGLTSVSAFALVFQVFYVIRAAFHEKDPEYRETLRKWILLVAPYIAFLSFATWTVFVGFANPNLVSRERRFFYCSVKDSSLTNSITAFSLGVLTLTVCLEIWIAYIIFSHWRVIRANDLGPRTGVDLNLICRIAAFSLWIFLGMGLSALSIKAPRSPVPDMALATMGTAVVLVFGTQRDILRAWMCCRWRRKGGNDGGNGGAGARRSSISSFGRTDSPASDHSVKRADLSPLSWNSKHEIPIQFEPQPPIIHPPPAYERKTKVGLSTRDISQPILREDLTFPVYGQAI